MFGIGFTEIVVLFLVAIVFIRPDDLPAFFRKLGKLFAEVKGAYNEVVAVKDEFIRELESTGEEAIRAETAKASEGTPGERIPDAIDSPKAGEGEDRPASAEEKPESIPGDAGDGSDRPEKDGGPRSGNS